MYKSPQDYVLARDTSYVESFNNAMNIFRDKRVAFSDMQYNMRSQLAVIHWNENVNRDLRQFGNYDCQKLHAVRKERKNTNYRYRQSIWDKYITSMFNQRRHYLFFKHIW